MLTLRIHGTGGEVTDIIAYDMRWCNTHEICVYLYTWTRNCYNMWILILTWIRTHIWSRFMHDIMIDVTHDYLVEIPLTYLVEIWYNGWLCLVQSRRDFMTFLCDFSSFSLTFSGSCANTLAKITRIHEVKKIHKDSILRTTINKKIKHAFIFKIPFKIKNKWIMVTTDTVWT